MPRINLELSHTMLSTLHERVGEHQALAWDKCNTCASSSTKQTWGRIVGKRLELDGRERLNFHTDIYGFQIGHDFIIRYGLEDGSRRHIGTYASYAHAKSEFFDDYRAVNGVVSSDKHTGKGNTDRIALGLYSTYYAQSGAYLDLVGELSYLHNKYTARNGTKASQDGYGILASVEAGKPYRMGNSNWLIEPQGQLTFQHLSLRNFDDGLKSVDHGHMNGVRGRVGVRLAYNRGDFHRRTDTFYIVGNLWHELSSPRSVKIGQDELRENYNRTWAEVGLGVQTPIGKQSYLYSDIRYEHALNKERHLGYRGTIGFKYRW